MTGSQGYRSIIRKFCLLSCYPVILLACFLSSCAGNRQPDYPPLEGTGFTDREWTQKERLIARSDFSVEIVRFVDNRNPRVEATDPYDNTIYDYDPDNLMQGVTARAPVLFNKYLAYRPRMAKHYRVEIELTRLKTRIRPGSLWDGQFGRYTVELEARVIARRSDSSVAFNRPYSIELERRRTTFNGRSPSSAMDRNRMYDLTEDAIRQMSEAIGWQLRSTDSHIWGSPKTDALPPAQLTTPTAPVTPTNPEVGAIEG
jgi:hypothetical protein